MLGCHICRLRRRNNKPASAGFLLAPSCVCSGSLYANQLQSPLTLLYTTKEIDMNIDDFTTSRERAIEFISKYEPKDVGFAAIISMCYAEILFSRCSGSGSQLQESSNSSSDTAPDWFIDTLPQFTGRRVTSTMIFKAYGRQATMVDLRKAGVWLRAMFGEPRRSNGQILFDIPMDVLPSGLAISPMMAGNDNAIAIASNVAKFMDQTKGIFTPQQVAKAIGAEQNNASLFEIVEALRKNGASQIGQKYLIGEK